jgi:AraC family transcriptional regulator of adaptative response / DNA-3-methyladenine glycosylase II
MLGRIARAFGDSLPDGETSAALPSCIFPNAARISQLTPEDIVALGLPNARARTLIGLARAVAAGTIRLDPESDVDATMTSLMELPGIGAWTANYIAMRALRWPDAFLPSDLGVLKALAETRPARALRLSEAWRPWRAYAVIHLWRNAA